jgi:hypothetical protein
MDGITGDDEKLVVIRIGFDLDPRHLNLPQWKWGYRREELALIDLCADPQHVAHSGTQVQALGEGTR